ncbi:hypothetical protein FOZ60_005370 [Perkinsus olseni]|uniref:Uncharacterized protein n=1 Tax=Perkinsus olseni TaxID=32597 RepID=A0A7J6NRZ6_PEROL|nr:hypothetical protein FOZ60_005370 [Perkinsus olseni]
MSSKHIITIAGVVTMLFVLPASLAIGTVKPDDDFPPLLNAGNDSCLFFNADFRAGRKALRVSYDATFKPRLNYITCPKTRSRDALQINFDNGTLRSYVPSGHVLWHILLKKPNGRKTYRGENPIEDPFVQDFARTSFRSETGDFKEFCLWVVYELKKRYGSYEEICVHFRQLIDTI